jgi:ferredoxin
MANINDRLQQNVPGKFYVTSDCIDCDLCRETAPTVFRRDDDLGFSVVFHQPGSEEELQQALYALYSGPVDAIVRMDRRPIQMLLRGRKIYERSRRNSAAT